MTQLNSALASAIDRLLSPFARQPPLVGLAIVALMMSVLVLALVRATTDARRLVVTKRALQACMFEVRLFNEDPVAMWRAVLEAMRHTLIYLRLLALPIGLTALLLTPLLFHLQAHYGYAGLGQGDRAIVKVRLTTFDQAGLGALALTVPPGLRLDSPVVWLPSLREAAWRILAEEPGRYDVGVHLAHTVTTKAVIVSPEIVRRSPTRVRAGFINQLVNPAEPPLPGSAGIDSIAVTYPSRDLKIFGWRLPWLLVLAALSTAATAVLRRPFRVVM